MSAAETRDAVRRTPSPAGSASDRGRGPAAIDDTSASAVSDNRPAGRTRHHVQGVERAGTDSPPANRAARLDVRLTAAEREAIRRRADRLGTAPSAWVRATVLDALDSRGGHVEAMEAAAAMAPSPELAAAVEQLRRVGVNLNQVLRRGGAVDDRLLGAVLGAVDEVRSRLGDRVQLS
ncbi:MAG: plasmid mobilization protein [Microbacteriaceae bacterium]|uniref:Mobilisation protein (MobC) n=1 Tax=Brevibacterium antiquum CNRZ 918 TaxID=1255637 RepID=A0A2H1KA97_9MICO|nr:MULTISPECIES: hypothetical protein [Brevibacterium]MDN5586692.1 hypothetical protein [Brevibacterium sp.]SMX96488.1 hypothetical protein BANT918_02225 [Brevibacterium antiquum CNRZ 918]